MSFLYALESIRNPALDAFFSAVTHAGEETLFIVFGLLLFWCVSKRRGYYLLIVGFAGTVINQFLKLFFRVPRPWVRDPDFTIVESARAEAAGYSFPSGHTQISVGAYGCFARCFSHPLVRGISIALCILVPFSRMYLGVHYPSDVLVSVVIAVALIFLLYPLVMRAVSHPRQMRMLFAALICMTAAHLLFVHLYPFPADIDAQNLSSGVKNGYTMLGCLLGMLATYEVDTRYTNFSTEGSLRVQAVKLIAGFALIMGIRAGLKAPLRALLHGSPASDCLRYFIMVAFAGCVWPLTFPHIRRMIDKNNPDS